MQMEKLFDLICDATETYGGSWRDFYDVDFEGEEKIKMGKSRIIYGVVSMLNTDDVVLPV